MLHIYGIVAAGHPLAPGLTGVADEPVRLVTARRLAAAVSAMTEDGPAGPPEVAAHARVLEELLLAGPVLPMRFGLAVPDDDTVVTDLRRSERGFLRALDRVRGHVEFNVKAYDDEDAVLEAVARSSPRVRAAAGRGGTDLMSRVELGELVAAEMATFREAAGRQVVDALAPLARSTAYGAPVAGAVVNASFLVAERDADAFVAAAGRLRQGDLARLDIRCTGPLPAYSFVDSTRG